MSVRYAIDSLALRNGQVFGWGWYLSETGPVRDLEIRVVHADGVTSRLRCRFGGVRPDLVEANPGIGHAGQAGFMIQGLLQGDAEHSDAEIVVIAEDGQRHRYPLGPLTALCPPHSFAESARRYLSALSLRSFAPNELVRVATRVLKRAMDSRRRRRQGKSLDSVLSGRDPLDVVLDHQLGGGANRFRDRLIAETLAQGRAVALATAQLPSLSYRLRARAAALDGEREFGTVTELLAALEQRRPEHIVINDLVSFDEPLTVLEWTLRQHALGARVTVYLHDYYAVCPVWTLIDDSRRYCGVPALSRCRQCLPRNGAQFLSFIGDLDVEGWRAAWGRLLSCAQLVAFSPSTVAIFRRAYPALDPASVRITPHQVDYIQARGLQPDLSLPLTVAVVGHITVPKGADIVRDMVELIERRELPMRMVVIGTIEGASPSPVLHITGNYDVGRLDQLLEEHAVGVCLLPSICPETFSYVTAELMQYSMPLAVFDLGAPAERVRGYPLGAIIPEMTAAAALDTLLTLRGRLLANSSARAAGPPADSAPRRAQQGPMQPGLGRRP